MSINTLLVQPLGDAPNSGARCFPNGRITVSESRVNVGPNLVHVRTDEFRAAFHDNPERHECRTTLVWVGILGILEHFFVQAWEHLLWWERGCERIESADTELFEWD